MLPDWIRPAGAGRAARRQPGEYRRDHAFSAPQRKSDLARHGDPWPDHSDDPASAHSDGHPGPNTDDNLNRHAHADGLRHRNGEPDPHARDDAIRNPLGNCHVPGDPNCHANGERDGPGSDKHTDPDRNPATTHSHAVYPHTHDAAHPDDSTDEAPTGVDLTL